MKQPLKPPAEIAKTTAVAKSAPPWPPQEKVKELASILDSMQADAEAMLKLDEQLGEATNDLDRRRIIQQVGKVIEHFEMTGGRACFKSGHLQKLWNECHPKSWWFKGTPAFSQIAKMIAVLMGSFPTSKIPEPEIFVRVLLDDVMELTPSFVEMESTCRQLRTTKTFMPAISEVLRELEAQQNLWNRREHTCSIIEEFYDDLCNAVANARVAAAAAVPMIENRRDMPMAPVSSPEAVKVDDDKGS